MKKVFILMIAVLFTISLAGCKPGGVKSDSLASLGNIENLDEAYYANTNLIREFVTLENGDILMYGNGSRIDYVDFSEDEVEILSFSNQPNFVGCFEESIGCVFEDYNKLYLFTDSSEAEEMEIVNPGEVTFFMQGNYLYMERLEIFPNYSVTVYDQDLEEVTDFPATYLGNNAYGQIDTERLYAYTYGNPSKVSLVDGDELVTIHEYNEELHNIIYIDGTDVLVYNLGGDYRSIFVQEDGTKTVVDGMALYNNKETVLMDGDFETPQKLYNNKGEVILEIPMYGVNVLIGEDRFIQSTHNNHKLYDGDNTLLSETSFEPRFSFQLPNLFIDTYGDFTIGRTGHIYFAMIGDEIIDAYQYIGMSDDYSALYYYVEEDGDFYLKEHTIDGVSDYSPNVVEEYFARFNEDEEFLDRELYIGLGGTFVETRVEDNKYLVDVYNENGDLLAGGNLVAARFLDNEQTEYLIYTEDGEFVTVKMHDFSVYL